MPEVPRLLEADMVLLPAKPELVAILEDDLDLIRDDAVATLVRPRAPRRPAEEPRAPRAEVEAGNFLLNSSSSRRRRSSSLRSSSSAALRASSCCFRSASASISAKSFVAPFHVGSRIRRWLCSVWDKMRVQVLSSVEAFETVLETDLKGIDVSTTLHHYS